MIEAFATNGADHPLDVASLPRRARCRQDFANAHGLARVLGSNCRSIPCCPTPRLPPARPRCDLWRLTSENTCETWAFAKSCLHRARLGSEATSSGVIGSVRRECLDHMIVLHETSLRRTLTSYFRLLSPMENASFAGKDAPEHERFTARNGIRRSATPRRRTAPPLRTDGLP